MAKSTGKPAGGAATGAKKKAAAGTAEPGLLAPVAHSRIGTMANAPAADAPIPLEQILGQKPTLALIHKALATGRLHHAWIFHGPPGIGKFTTAFALASRLLDPGGKDGDGSHASVMARAGTHPDLRIVRKEMAAISRESTVRSSKQATLALEVIREFLLEPAPLAPAMPSASPARKVFIVDEADMLAAEGQNAMLKTLEEPNPGTIIILVSSAAERLLPTVRSRCQLVAFEPLDDAAMNAWFDRAGVPTDPGTRRWLTWFAEGSPGGAALALKRGLSAWAPVRAMLDAALGGRFEPGLGPTMTKLIDEQAEATVAEAKQASKEAANRAWSRRMLAFAARHFRERLRETGGTKGATGDSTLRAIDLTQQAETAIAANVRYADVMENFAAQLPLGR